MEDEHKGLARLPAGTSDAAQILKLHASAHAEQVRRALALVFWPEIQKHKLSGQPANRNDSVPKKNEMK